MKKNRTYKVNAILMMLLAGTLSFSATAAASESGLLPEAAASQGNDRRCQRQPDPGSQRDGSWHNHRNRHPD